MVFTIVIRIIPHGSKYQGEEGKDGDFSYFIATNVYIILTDVMTNYHLVPMSDIFTSTKFIFLLGKDYQTMKRIYCIKVKFFSKLDIPPRLCTFFKMK